MKKGRCSDPEIQKCQDISIRNNIGIPTIKTRTLWRRVVSLARSIYDETGVSCNTRKLSETTCVVSQGLGSQLEKICTG